MSLSEQIIKESGRKWLLLLFYPLYCCFISRCSNNYWVLKLNHNWKMNEKHWVWVCLCTVCLVQVKRIVGLLVVRVRERWFWFGFDYVCRNWNDAGFLRLCLDIIEWIEWNNLEIQSKKKIQIKWHCIKKRRFSIPIISLNIEKFQ